MLTAERNSTMLADGAGRSAPRIDFLRERDFRVAALRHRPGGPLAGSSSAAESADDGGHSTERRPLTTGRDAGGLHPREKETA